MNEPQRLRFALAAFTGAVAFAIVLAGPAIGHTSSSAGPGTWCGGAQILAARKAFTTAWQPAHPVRTTKGALANGAERRPLMSFEPLRGCATH